MRTKTRKSRKVTCPKRNCKWAAKTPDPHAGAAALKDHLTRRH